MRNKVLMDLWMQAWVAYHTDGGVIVGGSDHCASSVIATLRVVNWELCMPIQTEPSREVLIEWMRENNMDDQVEYLMEE